MAIVNNHMKLESVILVTLLTLSMLPQALAQRLRAPKPLQTAPKIQSPEQQLQPWLSDCQRRISRHFENLRLKPFSCTFNFDSNNHVSAVNITKKSGSSTFDRAVIKAIKTSNLGATEPQDARLAFVQARGLRFEILDKPYPRIQMNLGLESK